MDDRRRAPRTRMLKSGKILLEAYRVPCAVRNLSETGVCLEVQTTFGIPSKFEFAMADQPVPITTGDKEQILHKSRNGGGPVPTFTLSTAPRHRLVATAATTTSDTITATPLSSTQSLTIDGRNVKPSDEIDIPEFLRQHTAAG
jgi:hypothetical protein